MLVQQTALCRDDMAGVTAERIALKMQQAYLNLGIQLSRLQAPLTAADAAAALKDIQDGWVSVLHSMQRTRPQASKHPVAPLSYC